MGKYKCGVCGYIHNGDDAPDNCPKCSATKDNFTEITGDDAKLIEKAKLTNEMHMAISSMLRKVQQCAKTIKDENLDPNCVLIADKVLKDTTETMQSIKAEIQAHVNKNKWG